MILPIPVYSVDKGNFRVQSRLTASTNEADNNSRPLPNLTNSVLYKLVHFVHLPYFTIAT